MSKRERIKTRRQKKNKQIEAEHTPANNLKGIGDICRYMGVVDGTTWHTPTAADFAELYGSAAENGNPDGAKRLGAWVSGSFAPLSGYAFGPNHNNVTLTTDNKVTSADPYYDGVVFWPANGYRYSGDNGAVHWIGSQGYYWSSTAPSSDTGHNLGFTSTTIIPQNNSSRLNALPVRCIRD